MFLLLPVFLSLFQFLSLPLPVFLFLFQFLSLPLPVFLSLFQFLSLPLPVFLFLFQFLSLPLPVFLFLFQFLSLPLPVFLSACLTISSCSCSVCLSLSVSHFPPSACLSLSLSIILSACLFLSPSASTSPPLPVSLSPYIYIYVCVCVCCIGQHCVNPSLMCKTHCPICFRNLYIAFSQSKHLEQRSLSLPFTVHFCSTFSFSTSEYYNSFSVTLLFLTAYSWKCHFEIWVCHDWDIDPSLVLSLSLRNYYVEVVVLWF